MNLDSLLSLALDAANEASKAILDERKKLKVWQKDDKSPVSSADLLANSILFETLSKSDISIVSEENLLGFKNELKTFWLIDPLDGTSGFINGSNEFCVMISLVHENRPILALIKNPTKDEIFYAHKESKVYKNDQILEPNLELFLQNKNKALLSVNHLSDEDKNFAKIHDLQALNIGSGLKFCALLEGRAGVYKRFESLNIWDICAGDFLINQNGGFMGDFSANLMQYNAYEFKSHKFIAVSHKSFLNDFL